MRAPPSYIAKAGVIGAPLTFPWNGDISSSLSGQKDQNVKLYRAVDTVCFKGKAALGVAINEWIAWRFEGSLDLSDISKRLDAARASTIHFRYCKDLTYLPFKEPPIHSDIRINGPLRIMLRVVGQTNIEYVNGNIYIAESVVRSATLARHLVPDPKPFDSWLTEAIRRVTQEFPTQPPYADGAKNYNASGEPPVPIETFDPEFVYTPDAGDAAIRAFLATLNPAQNRYLNTPDEMIAKGGFTGTPYVY